MLEIIIFSVVIIALVLLIIVIYNNKFQFSIIKMNEADGNIDILLQKKLDLLKNCVPIIKKSLKIDNFMNDLDSLSSSYDHSRLNDILRNNYNELFKTLDDNEKLYKSKKLVTIIEDINKNELELVAAIKFYNDSVVIYNNLIASFPSNIIRIIFGYKKKEFYNNEKREIFEILKDKQ